ncbi:unnamed protein product [Mytilus edulis]|uniref:B box-type domain-containing protein n=1 Tax=Mytilus edulis TaxID=6550 RepID=A0A8S3UII4_MYTED|nr:unnamed protein product [Mytilus edulis]
MTQSEKFCKPCSRSGRSSVAAKHCHDCEETLCSDCFQIHDTFRPLRTHRITDLGGTGAHTFLRSKFCIEHPGSKMEYYCTAHVCLCCKSCIGDAHSSCGKIRPVGVASKGVKKSTEFNDFVKTIAIMKKKVFQLKEKKYQDKEDLCDNKAKIQKRIRKFKSNVLKRIHSIEIELMAEVDSVFSNIILEAENEVNIIDQQAEHINEMCNQYEYLEKNGTDSDFFVVLKSNSKNIAQNLEDLNVALKSPLAGRPWDITIVPDSDEAWVTIPESSCIQHVDADSMNVDPPIKVPKCYGITLVEDNIALGRWGRGCHYQ